MALPVDQLVQGRCYQTPSGEVREIVSFDGERVIYVIERNGIRPVWNKAKWLTTRRDVFAHEVTREVVCH